MRVTPGEIARRGAARPAPLFISEHAFGLCPVRPTLGVIRGDHDLRFVCVAECGTGHTSDQLAHRESPGRAVPARAGNGPGSGDGPSPGHHRRTQHSPQTIGQQSRWRRSCRKAKRRSPNSSADPELTTHCRRKETRRIDAFGLTGPLDWQRRRQGRGSKVALRALRFGPGALRKRGGDLSAPP